MSDVAEVITGLTGNNAGIVFAAFVLLGTFYLFKQASDFLVKNITEQLQMISEEVKKTREALVAMQQSQIHFDGRLEKVEDVVSRIKTA